MRKITTILIAIILLVSCSKEPNEVINVELQGSWSLANAICYCAFDENTDFSVHGLVFNGSELSSFNRGEPQFLSDASGNYTVEGNLISFSNSRQFRYTIEDNILTLSFVDNPDIADDELTLVYYKNLPL